ncbi:hypothetical protein RHMOL_Rhmol05G0291200 [Rhododendron molle]|uniref:Uncharacterized protein n=1 Tax=Rhododendron molle TaxID=49168 RepID=A0ACC0NVA0_RHOML|nr:hypothetical protein RHMOL_Rhmol05G0291200 [Rhododendron molle]
MNKFEFDSNLGKLNKSSDGQIFIVFKLGSSSLKTLLNEHEYLKVRLNLARLQLRHKEVGGAQAGHKVCLEFKSYSFIENTQGNSKLGTLRHTICF